MPLLIGIVLAVVVAVFARVVGFDRDRAFYPTVLIIVGALYVLFAVMAGGGPGLVPELIGFAIFAGLAVVGFRTSLWIVAAGLAAHGVFDFVRYNWFPGPGAPEWWPGFCGGYDVAAAIALAAILVTANKKPADVR
ncbi:MAG TPA: hypothetical protein VF470_05030 [Sphingomicrobium sp.]